MSPLPIDIPRPTRALALALTAALLASLIPLAGAAAGPPPVNVTPATGGSLISADTNTSDGTGAPTVLTGPTFVESQAGAFTANGTITLTLPSGFQYAASSSSAAPAVTAGCGLSASIISYSGTPNVASVTLSGAPSSTACTIQFSGIAVVPSTHMPTSGAITIGGTAGANYSSSTAGTLTEVAGAAKTLTFTAQPTTATGGALFSPQPAVSDVDQYGNPRNGATVTLAIANATPNLGGTLSCSTATTVASGVATFSGCSIDKATSSYTLRATDGSASVLSNPIYVSVGNPYALAFNSYPSSPTTTNLGNIVVAVVDQGGNTVTTATGTVSLSIRPNASTFTCGGLTNPTATLYGGIATFTNCVQTVANVSFTLTASWPAASPTLTKIGNPFVVTSGPPAKLAFCWNSVCSTLVPAGSTGGSPLTSQPVIVLQDVNGNTVTSNATTTITLALASNTTGATLSCTGGLSKVVTAGVAAFSGCSIDKVGTYQLTATSSPYYTPATSGPFAVSAGPPTKLTFTAQPTSGAAGQAFPIQPVVAITDAGGNPATSSSATVTLSLNNPYGSSGALTCTGGLSKATYLGVATFSGCAISAAGTGYSITATATNVYPYVYLSPVTTNAFNVSLPPAQITLTPSASVIVWAKPVVLTAQFGTNGANKPFALQASLDKVHWYTIASLTTNASGAASFSYTPATNLWYQAVFAGTPDLGAATTTPFRVVVRQIALLRPTNSGKTKTIASGTDVTFTTTVRPARPELPKAKVTFTFTLYRDGHIVYSGKRDVYIDSAGLAKWTWKFGSSGLWYVRSIANPTTANANSVWSQIEKYYVP